MRPLHTCRCDLKNSPRLLAILVCLLSVGRHALAQDLNVDARRFAPPLDPNGSLVLEPTGTPGHLAYNVGLVNSYAYRPLVLRDASGNEVAVPIAHQFSSDVVLNTGLGKRFALGLRLPVVIHQTGDDTSNLGLQLSGGGFGDPAIDGKISVIPRGPLGGFGLATMTRLTLPLGDRQSGLANGAATGELRFLGDLDWIFAALRVSAGLTVRRQRTVLNDTYGDEMPWAIGILFRPRALGIDSQGRWQWFTEASGAVSLVPKFASSRASPAMYGVAARYSFSKDISALLGVQLPLDSAMGVPGVRAVLGLSWAPRFEDADEDGIADDADDCPELAEDRDNVEDDDGCPE